MFKVFKSKISRRKPSEETWRPAAPGAPAAPPEPPRAREIQYRRLEDRSSPDDSAVSAQASFRGEISGRAGARIAGEMQGNIRCDGLVWVKKTARVKGNIISDYVILEGALDGDIGPSLQVELRAAASMRGNIRTKLLAISEGTQFEGQIEMAMSEVPPVRFTEKRQPKHGRG